MSQTLLTIQFVVGISANTLDYFFWHYSKSRTALVHIRRIPWICYGRSFSEFYLSICNQLVSKGFSCLFRHRSHIYWFLPEETKCVFLTYLPKNKWISEFRRTNPQELKCWSTFCVDYFLRYYLIMQHQPIVKRVNRTHEWAHGAYQLLSLLLVQTQVARWKAATPEQLTSAHLYIDIVKSGYLFHVVGNVIVWKYVSIRVSRFCAIYDTVFFQLIYPVIGVWKVLLAVYIIIITIIDSASNSSNISLSLLSSLLSLLSSSLSSTLSFSSLSLSSYYQIWNFKFPHCYQLYSLWCANGDGVVGGGRCSSLWPQVILQYWHIPLLPIGVYVIAWPFYVGT